MPTQVYETKTVSLIDNTEIEISPLKIKYLKKVMNAFKKIKLSKNDQEAIEVLSECAKYAMEQFYPEIKTIEDLEDSVDLPTIYKVLDIGAGIKINEDKEETVKEQAESNPVTWETLDLVKLESEVLLLGVWKNFDELEYYLSMPELLSIIASKRELDYEEKKFLAAIQGVDLDQTSGKQDEWEKMKARVFSGGKAKDSNDILSYQGVNAQKAGFGIGMGLGYEDLTKK